MKQLQVRGGLEVPVPSVNESQSTLAGQAMVERAKSVIVVAGRVDEKEATQILLDAASEADLPVRLVAGQVMTALHTEAEEGVTQDASVHDTLIRALGAVRLTDPAQDHAPAPGPRSDDRAN